VNPASVSNDPVWSGQWVSDHLEIAIETKAALTGLAMPDLVGMALRNNPKRAHLLVSLVLGKHLPTDPRIVYGAGRLLGALVADRITAVPSVPDRAGAVLKAALSEGNASTSKLVEAVDALPRLSAAKANEIDVLGYAETATALGHTVAEQLGAAYLHSTRRPVAGVASAGGFQEEHSHATDHLLLPEDPALFASGGALVLVDDELSTGQTVLNTIAALHGRHRRELYIIATLVDLRSATDRARLADTARELGTTIDVVSFAAGQLSAPPNVLARAAALVADLASDNTQAVAAAPDDVRTDNSWPIGARDGGRHGFSATDCVQAHAAAAAVAQRVRMNLISDRVLVLGFEELMYAPLLIGVELANQLASTGGQVRYSTTTRSPVLAVDDPGYAIRTKIVFSSHDDPADGSGPRFAYNVIGARFGDIVFVVDSSGDTDTLHADAELLAQLRAACDRLQVVRIPSYRAETTEMTELIERGARP
jgi:adenine/guanine phosphoribosyltransferase-like PRPP-binding protein